MTKDAPLVLDRYWVSDERTGKRRPTSWRMTEADARERYGDDAVADPRSRAERTSVDSAADVLTKAGGASSK